MDRQRSSEVKMTTDIFFFFFFRFCSHLTVLPSHPPPSLQVSPPSSVPPVSRRRSQKSPAHPGHPGPAGGLSVSVLVFSQGKKWDSIDQRS